jgi:hypothetical protein
MEPDYVNDAIIESGHGDLGSKVSLSASGEFIGEFNGVEAALDALKAWAEDNNYFPTLWFVDDHGGMRLIDYEGNILDPDEFGVDFEELWEEAVAHGATVYDVVSFDHEDGTPENMGNAQVVQHPSGQWLYVDDVDGYDHISEETVNSWFADFSDVELVPA